MIVIRRQPDIIRASYAQYVAGGGTFGLARYLDSHSRAQGALTRAYKAPAFEYDHFDYDRLIARYDAAFGADRVHVYPYEWIRDQDAFLNRLRADLGVDLPPLPPAASGSVNRSLGRWGQTVLRGVNLFTRQSVVNKTWLVPLPGGQIFRHAAKRAIQFVPWQGRDTLPAEVAAFVADRYRASNARLAALRPDLPLADLGYPL